MRRQSRGVGWSVLMEIIKDNIENVLIASNYVFKEKYPDNPLNSFYNYWNFLNEYEEELIDAQNASLESILYSKYYWFSRLTDRFHEIYGFDAGIDQQQSMIIDEMDQRLDHVDWDFVEILHHGK